MGRFIVAKVCKKELNQMLAMCNHIVYTINNSKGGQETTRKYRKRKYSKIFVYI